MKTGEIAFAIGNQERTLHYLLRLADVENVKMKYEQALDSRELAKQLGIDHKVIRRLVQEGHLRRKSRRTVDAYHAPKFDVDTARRLLHRYNMTSPVAKINGCLETEGVALMQSAQTNQIRHQAD